MGLFSDALLQSFDVLCVHGELPAGEPQPVLLQNRRRDRTNTEKSILPSQRHVRRVLSEDATGELPSSTPRGRLRSKDGGGGSGSACASPPRTPLPSPPQTDRPSATPWCSVTPIEGHPATPETRGLHGRQRRRQLAHLHLRNEALERLHVVLPTAAEAADVGLGLRRRHEPDAVVVGGGAADGDVADVREMDELTDERGEGGHGRREGGTEGLDGCFEGRHSAAGRPRRAGGAAACSCGTISHWSSGRHRSVSWHSNVADIYDSHRPTCGQASDKINTYVFALR